MPLDWAPLIANVKQISPTILLAVVIATGTALFVGDDLAARFGITELRNTHRLYVGGAFIASGAWLAAYLFTWAAKASTKSLRSRRATASRVKSLHSLTTEEKLYLLPYVVGGLNSQYFQLEDGVAAGLVLKRILFRPSAMGRARTGFAFNLHPWARDYLTLNRYLLEDVLPQSDDPSET